MDDFIPKLADRIRVADLLLTGGWDPVSQIIQVGSRSPFSHAAVVTGPQELTEAYDYALTPAEWDEGIFPVSLTYFMKRSRGMRRIRILRPVDVDAQRVVAAARHLHHHSPGFPSLGMAFLALCGLSGPVLRVLPEDVRRRLTIRQVRLAADGVRRMHCAETVIRIFQDAGLPLRFNAPRLGFHIDQLVSIGGDRPLGLPTGSRIAAKGSWPDGRQPVKAGRSAAAGLRSLRDSWRERVASESEFDMADLILPGDFARAEPFELVAEFVRTSRGWTEAPGAVSTQALTRAA